MRSRWKTPVFNPSFIFYKRPKTIEKHRRVRKLRNKDYRIYVPMVSRFFRIYNGNRWRRVGIGPDMLGHKFGEFIRCRRKVHHLRKKREKAKAKKLKEMAKKAPKRKVMTEEQRQHIEEMKRKRKKRK